MAIDEKKAKELKNRIDKVVGVNNVGSLERFDSKQAKDLADFRLVVPLVDKLEFDDFIRDYLSLKYKYLNVNSIIDRIHKA